LKKFVWCWKNKNSFWNSFFIWRWSSFHCISLVRVRLCFLISNPYYTESKPFTEKWNPRHHSKQIKMNVHNKRWSHGDDYF
jgi:hypothetical protein